MTEAEKYLLARAVQHTRVSKFTKEERAELVRIVLELLGYRIEGGL
jgi:hypothetical protein